MFLRCFICDYRYPEAEMVKKEIPDGPPQFEGDDEGTLFVIYVCKPCATIHHDDQEEPSDEQEEEEDRRGSADLGRTQQASQT